MPHLEITEVVLVHCNIVKIINMIQESCRHLLPRNCFVNCYMFHLKNFVFLKTFNSEISYTEVWFTDQNSKPLDVKDKLKITLVIN